MGQRILVTGAAGFIGRQVAEALLARGDAVVGLDNLNDYYAVTLKQARLATLTPHPSFTFQAVDVADLPALDRVFAENAFDGVIHLAAQAGVRYSLTNPHVYAQANLVGFLNMLECCRNRPVRHLVYASSSSVYGANQRTPFATSHNVDHPVSLYAATKKSNELMAHAYSKLFAIPTTGLRFFTVYGPWGRPDMAIWLFTEAILAGRPIQVFNQGRMQRDFTYIDDIVEGVVRVYDRPPASNAEWNGLDPDPATSFAPYRVYNIGNHQPVELLRMIDLLERSLGRSAEKVFLPMQPGDVPATYADTADLMRDVGFHPKTPLELGIPRFVDWYRAYHDGR